MKPIWLLFLLLILLPSFIEWKSDELVKKIDERSAKFPLKNVTNSITSLEKEMKSKGLIVIFSCNTCPFVIGNDGFSGWEKTYNLLYKKASKEELGLVLLNSNEGKRETDDSFVEMQKRAKKEKYNMPYLLDENAFLANSFKAKTTPHVFVLNSKWEVIYQGSIDNFWDNSRKEDKTYLVDLINQISTQKEITTIATEPRGCSIKRKK